MGVKRYYGHKQNPVTAVMRFFELQIDRQHNWEAVVPWRAQKCIYTVIKGRSADHLMFQKMTFLSLLLHKSSVFIYMALVSVRIRVRKHGVHHDKSLSVDTW